MMSKVETKNAKHAQQRIWKTRKQDADSDERTRIRKRKEIQKESITKQDTRLPTQGREFGRVVRERGSRCEEADTKIAVEQAVYRAATVNMKTRKPRIRKQKIIP